VLDEKTGRVLKVQAVARSFGCIGIDVAKDAARRRNGALEFDTLWDFTMLPPFSRYMGFILTVDHS
jgi:hypothetical protein